MIPPSSPLVFFSDVHLGVYSGNRAVQHLDRFTAFLDLVLTLNPAGVYIVGDLFDFWFEYRSVVPRGYHRVLTRLEDLRLRGATVAYLAGNHDFAIGSAFSRDLGITVVPDRLTFDHDGHRFHLYHGDGLAVRDRGYHLLKAVLRHRLAQASFRLLHPDLAFSIAHAVSHSSRDYTSTKKYGPLDGMLLDAERRIDEGADFVIMGHRHQPLLRPLGTGLYMNLGDWLRFDTFGLYQNGTLSLQAFREGRMVPHDEGTMPHEERTVTHV